MDSNSMVGQILNPPIIARYIRIHPKAWYGHICMRVELFGCKEGTLIEMTYCISGLDHLGYITAISIRGNKYSVLGTELKIMLSEKLLSSLTDVIHWPGFSPPVTKKCAKILGMQNDQIPDSALSASTSYNVNSMGPANGRLHFQSKSGQYGAWAVSKNDEFQWFQVDFGGFTKVSGLATQGRQDGAWWVKSYSLSYSYDGVFFEDYKEDNVTKVS